MKIAFGRSYTAENPRNPAASGTFTSAPANPAPVRDTKGDVRAFKNLLFRNWNRQAADADAEREEAERQRTATQQANDELRAAFNKQRNG